MSLGLKPSTSIGQDLHSAAINRMAELGYLSYSAYIVGLIRADMIHQIDHTQSLKISRLSGRARDEIDDAMLEATKTREPTGSEQCESESIIQIMKENRGKCLASGSGLRAVS